MDIYGMVIFYLFQLFDFVMDWVCDFFNKEVVVDCFKLYEYLIGWVKVQVSMEEKCCCKGYLVMLELVLMKCKDVIGIWVVCNFIDDVYCLIDWIKVVDWCMVVEEKDYIENVKFNGYWFYYLILDVFIDFFNYMGYILSYYFVEIQLCMIVMDLWVLLEYEMKYKYYINDLEWIEKEFCCCVDQLVFCDV